MRRQVHQSGFTYMGLLFFVAIMGVLLAASGEIWSSVGKRAKERELLYIGHQFRAAIKAYYQSTPGAVKRYPGKLDDLLMDRRQAGTVRHLRRIYLDPMTGKPEWGVVRAADGGIQGVFSLSEQAPLKTAGFGADDAQFERAATYAQWRFEFRP